MTNYENKKGFTLVELLVVIAIVALLASIALVAMGNARKDGRNTKRDADIKQTQVALEIYFDEWKTYPDAEDDTPAILNFRWDSSCDNGVYSDDWISALMPKYMLTTPDDPTTGRTETQCYQYEKTCSPWPCTPTGKSYSLIYLREDKAGFDNCRDVDVVNNYVCIGNSAD